MFSKNLTIALDDKEAGVSEELRIIHKSLRKCSKNLKIVIHKYRCAWGAEDNPQRLIFSET